MLGPGLLESVYESVLARSLVRQGLQVERQVNIRFEYDGMVFAEGLRCDLIVDGLVLLESRFPDQDPAQDRALWNICIHGLTSLRSPLVQLINMFRNTRSG